MALAAVVGAHATHHAVDVLAAAGPGRLAALATGHCSAHAGNSSWWGAMSGQHTPRGILVAMRIIIIGGVAGGMSAATRLRRLLEDADITVVERSGHVSYANCGLPYHVGGVIEERSSLLLQTPRALHRRFGLDVRVHHEALRIDRERHVVVVRDLRARRGARAALRRPRAVHRRPRRATPDPRHRARPLAARRRGHRRPRGRDPRRPHRGRRRRRLHRRGGHREPRAPRPRGDPRRGGRPGHDPARPRDGHPGARPHPRARRRPAARRRRGRHRPRRP